MIQSQLSRVRQQSESCCQGHEMKVLRQACSQLKALRREQRLVVQGVQGLQEETRKVLGEWAGKVSHILFRQLKEKHFLQGQIEKSRVIQQSMKGEVIKLKQMIQTAVEDYQQQLHRKNALLQEKDQEIKLLIRQIRIFQKTGMGGNLEQSEEGSARGEDSKNSRRESLEIIQEESEHATHSSAALSLRDFKDEEKIKMPQTVISNSRASCNIQTPTISSPEKENIEPRPQHKRTKTFIDHFRKTIGESFSEKYEQEKERNCPIQMLTLSPAGQFNLKTKLATQLQKEPLRELSSNQQSSTRGQSSKETTSYNLHPPPQHQQSNPISKSSSSSDLIISNEAERINLPKKFQTPINLIFFKKKEAPLGRIMTEPLNRAVTEPSPERPSSSFGGKGGHSQKRIFHEKKPSCEKAHSIDESKSVKSSLSRQKIKITAKMVQETGVGIGTSAKKGKALVYLGGKSVFRKFLLELKAALRRYTITISFPEIKYQGGRRNGQRWGQGRLLYQNGYVYEGQFRENMRWGRGALSLNGITIYEGEWMSDCVCGQGYIKSMRFMGSGGTVFNQASYCGNLLENRLHGIGTLFLNGKEKIVTKFNHGVPIGQLTYYNFHDIEFGVWPTD